MRALLVCCAALLLAPSALADGGPDPGVLQGGAGIANTGGTVRFVTVQAGRLTTLEAIATRGGQVVGSRVMRGGWGIPLVDYGGTTGGLAADGRTLVLAQSGYQGVCTKNGCTPFRRRTSFQIVDTKTLHRRTTVTLPGDYAFDALSPSGKRLYLIQHTSTANTNRYVVRAYDIRQMRLLPGRIADRSQRGWVMQGVPMARATGDGGRFVYTLYANPGGYPFVHALDSVAGTARCIGIPWTREQTTGDLNLLTLSKDGRSLTIGAVRPTGPEPYFRLDTVSYRVTAIAAPHGSGFPWWTLTLLVLLAPVLLVVVRRRAGHVWSGVRLPMPE